VAQLKPIHDAQLLTYKKLANIQQGFLINFNVEVLKTGLKSFIFLTFKPFMTFMVKQKNGVCPQLQPEQLKVLSTDNCRLFVTLHVLVK